MPHDPRPIALVGLSGAGKSACARALGARLGLPVRDLDATLERLHGAPVSALFERHGEAWFRAREREALDEASRGAGVIACGGGVVVTEEARELLRSRCRVAWLTVTPAEAARRLAAERGTRPLLAGGDPEVLLAALLAERAPHYEALATVRVDTLGHGPDAVAGAVAAALGAESAA